MSWSDTRRLAARLLVVTALAAMTAGCFQPMYADRSITGGSALREKLQGVEVPPLNVPNGSREARLGVALRNELAFNMYGSAVGGPVTHQLVIRLTTSRTSVMIDPTTARADNENYGIDASYVLKDATTDKVVLTGTTFSRVAYDIPGQEQRFARTRALRDAEDRAVKIISDNISQRLASFFVAGS